jgi:hypothetical protein
VGPEDTSIASKRCGKEVSAATDTQATTEEFLGTMFSIRSVQSGYKEELIENSRVPEIQVSSYRELGSNMEAEMMAL